MMTVNEVVADVLTQMVSCGEVSVNLAAKRWGTASSTLYAVAAGKRPAPPWLVITLLEEGLLGTSTLGGRDRSTPMFFARDGEPQPVLAPHLEGEDRGEAVVQCASGFDIPCEDVDGNPAMLRLSTGMVRQLKTWLATLEVPEERTQEERVGIPQTSEVRRREDTTVSGRYRAAARCGERRSDTSRQGKVNTYMITGVPGHSDPVPMTRADLAGMLPPAVHRVLDNRLRNGIRDLEGLRRPVRERRQG